MAASFFFFFPQARQQYSNNFELARKPTLFFIKQDEYPCAIILTSVEFIQLNNAIYSINNKNNTDFLCDKSRISRCHHRLFCLFILHLDRVHVQLSFYPLIEYKLIFDIILISEKLCIAVCDDQTRQKSPTATQTSLCGK